MQVLFFFFNIGIFNWNWFAYINFTPDATGFIFLLAGILLTLIFTSLAFLVPLLQKIKLKELVLQFLPVVFYHSL